MMGVEGEWWVRRGGDERICKLAVDGKRQVLDGREAGILRVRVGFGRLKERKDGGGKAGWPADQTL